MKAERGVAVHGAHKRDPINAEWWFFAEPGINNRELAQRFHDLALAHFISFRGIFKMIVAVLQEYRELAEESECNLELANKFKLPIAEALSVWMRSREGLLRLAELLPERAEEIEAQVAEQQEVFFAMLERYERKWSGDGKED
jgi:hypothetical protein